MSSVTRTDGRSGTILTLDVSPTEQFSVYNSGAGLNLVFRRTGPHVKSGVIVKRFYVRLEQASALVEMIEEVAAERPQFLRKLYKIDEEDV